MLPQEKSMTGTNVEDRYLRASFQTSHRLLTFQAVLNDEILPAMMIPLLIDNMEACGTMAYNGLSVSKDTSETSFSPQQRLQVGSHRGTASLKSKTDISYHTCRLLWCSGLSTGKRGLGWRQISCNYKAIGWKQQTCVSISNGLVSPSHRQAQYLECPHIPTLLRFSLDQVRVCTLPKTRWRH